MTRASTLTASSTEKTSDARPHAPRPSAWPVIRQSVVKVASSITSNVRRGRPPAFTGTAWHLASNAQAMLAPSHACLLSGKGRVKVAGRPSVLIPTQYVAF